MAQLNGQSRASARSARVLHLDHTSEPGGAELALLRVLTAPRLWRAALRVPGAADGGAGVFEPLARGARMKLILAGVRQKPGASGHLRLSSLSAFVAAAVLESLQLRASRAFRTADVVHANTSRSAVYGAVASWATRKALVVHLRDMVSPESLGGVGYQLFTRLALRRADAVIANSASTLASAEPHLGPRVARHVIPSPIGLAPRAEAAVVRPFVLTVGMVARIDPWKGQDLLLEAFAAAFAGTATRLVFAGGAPFGKHEALETLRARAEALGVEDRVDYLGHVDDVWAAIERFDICVQASTRPEPLGQNVLQYLVSGKPVIAVDAGGPAEWIRHGENGLLVQLGSVEELTDALRALAADVRLREALARGAAATPGIGSDDEIAALHGEVFDASRERRRGRRR